MLIGYSKLYMNPVLTKKYGGGCGYNFSKLRPKGDSVGGEPGLAAVPVNIMQMFDLPTSIFRQQGKYEKWKYGDIKCRSSRYF